MLHPSQIIHQIYKKNVRKNLTCVTWFFFHEYYLQKPTWLWVNTKKKTCFIQEIHNTTASWFNSSQISVDGRPLYCGHQYRYPVHSCIWYKSISNYITIQLRTVLKTSELNCFKEFSCKNDQNEKTARLLQDILRE